MFGSWVRKRHPELIVQLEDLFEAFYDELARFERNEQEGSILDTTS